MRASRFDADSFDAERLHADRFHAERFDADIFDADRFDAEFAGTDTCQKLKLVGIRIFRGIRHKNTNITSTRALFEKKYCSELFV